MAAISFYKYQATGNDFILIDYRDTRLHWSLDKIKKICDRKFGIGSDGLILIQDHVDHDFEMVFYNPDGSQSLCGNGSRCAVNFAHYLGLISKKTSFLAFDGEHKAEILMDGQVRLRMSDVQNVRFMEDGMFVDTGSPHLIREVMDIENFDVFNSGRVIRYNDIFKASGVNVNFIQFISDSTIFVRTYERGVENETLSCGTGVTASAIAISTRDVKSPIKVNTRGGTLMVDFKQKIDGSFTDVYLTGPALPVFKGTIELDN